MSKSKHRRVILMADDDAEDCLLARDALGESGRACELRVVRNGEELFDYLRREGEFVEGRNSPIPDLILLDLKMPCKDGRETLRELKNDPRFRRIPVVALTTSTAGDDVEFSYDVGANSYITKPATFHEWIRIFGILGEYWFDIVELPPRP